MTATTIPQPKEENTINPELKQNLLNGTSLNAQEHICTVDSNNIPTQLGHTRREMRLQNIWHRATHIIILHQSDKDDEEEHVLIQRRSKIKDYCPSKLDPTPGGVVEFGESYEENVTRELLEEMNISVLSNDENNKNSCRRLFTFKYVDNIVSCWGDLWEVIYRGSMEDLQLQESEVEDVLRLSFNDVKRMMKEHPTDFMPDGLHALELYFQHRLDIKVQRKLVRGYSSSNHDDYDLRPNIKAIFFDCDDCLYFDNWGVANQLTDKIESWCVSHGLAPGQAYELYKKYGTALKGLLSEGYIPNCETSIDNYLRDVHDIPIHSLLKKDEKLRKMILEMDPSIPRFIFTASVRHHAERCLKALGIDDLFQDIIDVKACSLATKHSPEAFEAAMRIANVNITDDFNPESCILIDDSLSNLCAARDVGWRSVLVGRVGRDCGKVISSEFAEFEISRIHDLPKAYPEWFREKDVLED